MLSGSWICHAGVTAPRSPPSEGQSRTLRDSEDAARRQLQVAMGNLDEADKKRKNLVEKLTWIRQELMQIDHEVPEPLRDYDYERSEAGCSVPPEYIENVD